MSLIDLFVRFSRSCAAIKAIQDGSMDIPATTFTLQRPSFSARPEVSSGSGQHQWSGTVQSPGPDRPYVHGEVLRHGQLLGYGELTGPEQPSSSLRSPGPERPSECAYTDDHMDNLVLNNIPLRIFTNLRTSELVSVPSDAQLPLQGPAPIENWQSQNGMMTVQHRPWHDASHGHGTMPPPNVGAAAPPNLHNASAGSPGQIIRSHNVGSWSNTRPINHQQNRRDAHFARKHSSTPPLKPTQRLQLERRTSVEPGDLQVAEAPTISEFSTPPNKVRRGMPPHSEYAKKALEKSQKKEAEMEAELASVSKVDEEAKRQESEENVASSSEDPVQTVQQPSEVVKTHDSV
jgi:hypothetical protein